MKFRSSINNFRAGYNYARSFNKPVTPGSLITAVNTRNLAFQLGKTAGMTVNVTINTAKTFFRGVKGFVNWINSASRTAYRAVVKNVPVIAKKIIQSGRIVGIKVASTAKAVGKEVANIGKDIADRIKTTAQDTKAIYNLKKNRYVAKHGKQPSAGTKARYGYDAYVQARADRMKGINNVKANSKTVQFVRDFKKAANSAVGDVMRKTAVRIKDAALVGAGIYGLTQLFDSPEEGAK